MTGFWKRGDELERNLRADRPEPRPEFLHAVADRVLSSRYRRSARLRVALAGGISGIVVVSLAAFGGLGYAASAMKHAAGQAAAVVTPAHQGAGPQSEGAGQSSLGNDAVSSAQGQYGKKVTICHHTGSSTNPTVTITISVHALPAHLAHGDTIGPC